jgi:hypothetical protein
MNRVDSSVPLDEGVDALLSAFFKGEMPSPWPEFKAPARTLPFRRRAAPARRRPIFGSRFALVASVALLMCAAWLLGGKVSVIRTTPLPTLPPGTSTLKNRLPVGIPTPQEPKKDLPAGPKADPVPAVTIEVDKEGRAGLKLTFPRIIPNK